MSVRIYDYPKQTPKIGDAALGVTDGNETRLFYLATSANSETWWESYYMANAPKIDFGEIETDGSAFSNETVVEHKIDFAKGNSKIDLGEL